MSRGLLAICNGVARSIRALTARNPHPIWWLLTQSPIGLPAARPSFLSDYRLTSGAPGLFLSPHHPVIRPATSSRIWRLAQQGIPWCGSRKAATYPMAMPVVSRRPKSAATHAAWIDRYGRNARCELTRGSTHSWKNVMQGSRAPPLPRSHALTCKISTITGQGLAKALATGAADAGHRVEPVDVGSA